MRLSSVILAALVTFTLPSADRSPTACDASGPLTGLGYVRVIANRQSPTWVAKRDSMLAFPAVWTRLWPIVRAEAANVTISRTPVSADSAGRPYSLVPALQWHPAWVRVACEDLDGNVACPSQYLWVP